MPSRGGPWRFGSSLATPQCHATMSRLANIFRREGDLAGAADE
jgi:hypothetical protein